MAEVSLLKIDNLVPPPRGGSRSPSEFRMTTEFEFWNQAASRGLPCFRAFRRSVPIERIDCEMSGSRLEPDWMTLKSSLEPDDKVWPFKLNVRKYLGMSRGYVVLRNGKPIGGLVIEVSWRHGHEVLC